MFVRCLLIDFCTPHPYLYSFLSTLFLFCLHLPHSFGGPTLYQNPAYVSPNEHRAAKKRSEGSRYADRSAAKAASREKTDTLVRASDPTDDIFKG
jgi:hypothetical protein